MTPDALIDARTTELLNVLAFMLLVVVVISGWILVTREDGEQGDQDLPPGDVRGRVDAGKPSEVPGADPIDPTTQTGHG